MKKIFVLIFLLLFLTHWVSPCYGYLALDYLCELGKELYQQGRYNEALRQFQKILLVQPNYRPALEYVQKIENLDKDKEQAQPWLSSSLDYNFSKKKRAIKDTLDLLELQREISQTDQADSATVRISSPIIARFIKESPDIIQTALPFKVLRLEDLAVKTDRPIEIEQGQTIILSGKSISRFLATQTNVLNVEKKNADQVLISGNHIGYSYFHIWDEGGRKTLEFLTVPARPQGPTLEEKMRAEERRARNFKLAYAMDWSMYESGRRLHSLDRLNYSYMHNLDLRGETPYGDFDSSITVSQFDQHADLSYITAGLTNASIAGFENFNLRVMDFFDIPPDFSNLIFPGISLRGGMLESWAFDKLFSYTAFAGRENWSSFGGLAPSLTRRKNAYVGGVNLKFSPLANQDYQLTLVRGWGDDREEGLNELGFDISSSWIFNKWRLNYEFANDSDTSGHLFKTEYNREGLNFGGEIRNISKNFHNIVGDGWLQGELGGLLYLNYRPIEKLDIYANLDVYQDRLYPAEDNYQRWNENLDINSAYYIDPLTTLRFNYTLRNELGRVSKYRYQNIDLGISKTLNFIRDIYFFCNFYHQENDSFTTPSASYINERIYAGIRVKLIQDLYYYVNKEVNWLDERSTSQTSSPRALETGLDWSGQISDSPWHAVLRFTYRDEEDASSSLSFLSGEDYIEGYSEISYRPRSDFEIFGSCRVRNVWADKPDASKRLEASFYAGLRYIWDTGVKWDPRGNIDGFVFKDYNADGIMQRGEPPVEGVKVWLGKSCSLITDIFGYFKFEKIRGRKITVSLDTLTVPQGFVLTTPSNKLINIKQNCTNRVFFGIVARSEISGFVFEDINANGKYDRKDKGVRKAIITLEDGSSAITDDTGRYAFPLVAAGEHTLTLDMNSLPIYYLPTVAVKKEITLFEGVTYHYHIPLKRNK